MIEQITWLDSESDEDWRDIDFYKKEINEDTPILTLGYVILENKKYVCIVQNCDTKNKTFSNSMKIPKKMIIKRKKL